MCPNGVEWKTLGEVAKLERGVVISKEYLRDNAGDYPVYSSQTENNGEFGKINTYRYNGAYVTWTTDGAYAGTVFRRYGKFNITNVCGLINILDKDSIDVNYLYYILSITTKKYVNEGMGNPKLMSNVMAKVKIPLPPLAIQSCIVEILDNFTNLTANLAAELALRRKQYETNREKLLSLEGVEGVEGVEWKRLGEIGKVCMCKRIMKYQTTEKGDIPFYKIGTFGKTPDAYISKELFEEYKTKYSFPHKGDILISAAGTIGKTVVYDGEPAYFQDSNIVWLANNEKIVLNTYLAYCYQMSPWKVSGGGTIARLYNDNIANAEIPVPPLEVQKHIVSILDKFTALIENIENELALRQKQYEYYREELLRFER